MPCLALSMLSANKVGEGELRKSTIKMTYMTRDFWIPYV